MLMKKSWEVVASAKNQYVYIYTVIIYTDIYIYIHTRCVYDIYIYVRIYICNLKIGSFPSLAFLPALSSPIFGR